MDQQSIVLFPIHLDDLTQKIIAGVVEALQPISSGQEERLISAEEARKIFNPSISKVTLHAWTKAGHIPVHRVGGRIYYKQSEIIESAKRLTKYNRDKQLA